MNGNSKRRPYTPKGWPTMTLARWWATVGRRLQAVAPKLLAKPVRKPNQWRK